MLHSVSELALHGKQLSPAEHEQLVDELLSSLNEPAVAQLDAAWSDEVARRLEPMAGVSYRQSPQKTFLPKPEQLRGERHSLPPGNRSMS
jgi:putative addiction module component (TIGR02574 family)